MLGQFKALSLILLSFSLFAVHADEVVLNRMAVQFYDEKGNPTYKPADTPKVTIKNWSYGTDISYFYQMNKSAVIKKINGKDYAEMIGPSGANIYLPMSVIIEGKWDLKKPGEVNKTTQNQTEKDCTTCTKNYQSPTNKTIESLIEAGKKNHAANHMVNPRHAEINPDSYRSSKQVDYGGWSLCSNILRSDGSLGPWGKTLVKKMYESKADFTRSNPGMQTVCPNFERFDETEKFDYYVWVFMALIAEESECKPNAVSDAVKNGKCFNGPGCQRAYGLCQLPLSWGNMTNPDVNIRSCVKTLKETVVEGGAHIGVSPRSNSSPNHFGPFNVNANSWRNYKKKLNHFLGQWHDKCGPFPDSVRALSNLRK